MPIEIRELVIRATVDPREPGAYGPSPSAAAAQSASAPHHGADDDLVQTCIREVLRILDDKRER
jgi:hypothetical protein